MSLHRPRRILVPVDFSPRSSVAVDYALGLARQYRSVVQLLHVWEPDAVVTDSGRAELLDEFARSRAGEAMRCYLEALENHGVRVMGRLEEGDLVETIVEVGSRNFDLIVMGTHGRTGWSHLVHGSVAERVVRQAPCPVTTLRVPDPDDRAATGEPAWVPSVGAQPRTA